MTTEQNPHCPPAPAIPPALADLRDILDDVSDALDWMQTDAQDDPLTVSEVEHVQIILRQRLAFHAETYHGGLRLGYAHFATIDGPMIYNAAQKSWQDLKSPGALCTEAEAEAIAASTVKRNETIAPEGIKTPRGWTAYEPKNKEA